MHSVHIDKHVYIVFASLKLLSCRLLPLLSSWYEWARFLVSRSLIIFGESRWWRGWTGLPISYFEQVVIDSLPQFFEHRGLRWIESRFNASPKKNFLLCPDLPYSQIHARLGLHAWDERRPWIEIMSAGKHYSFHSIRDCEGRIVLDPMMIWRHWRVHPLKSYQNGSVTNGWLSTLSWKQLSDSCLHACIYSS